jgi:hypothetical protein
MAVALVAGGLLSQLHGSGATPVSAQTVINRAAAAGPAAGQAQHFIYRLTTSDGYAGTADLWVGSQAIPDGPIALTESMSRNGVDAPALNLQFVLNGAESRTYDPATNKIVVGSPDFTSYSGLRLLLGVFAGRKIGNALESGAGAPPASQLTHVTFNGVSAYSVTMGDLGTLYFNDQSYRLEGLNWTDGSHSWQARLLNEAVIPLTSVPAGTFTLHAPASAQTVAGPAPTKKTGAGVSIPVDFFEALAAVCRTTPETIKSELRTAPGATALQVCQQTRPGVTADQLFSDLLSQIKIQLDSAVASGTITRSQADAAYSGLQPKLRMFITSPIAGPANKQ